MLKHTIHLLVLALLLSMASPLAAQSRIKDIGRFAGVRSNSLIGYGLVIGLNKTGDKRQTFFTQQSLVNMLERFGLTVNNPSLRVENIAAVMVTANLPAFDRTRLEGKIEKPLGMLSFRGALSVVGLILLAFFGQLVFLQIIGHGEYAARAEANRLSHTTIVAERGLILDRRGEPIAANAYGATRAMIWTRTSWSVCVTAIVMPLFFFA